LLDVVSFMTFIRVQYSGCLMCMFCDLLYNAVSNSRLLINHIVSGGMLVEEGGSVRIWKETVIELLLDDFLDEQRKTAKPCQDSR
jgi:hypothetical protein